MNRSKNNDNVLIGEIIQVGQRIYVRDLFGEQQYLVNQNQQLNNLADNCIAEFQLDNHQSALVVSLLAKPDSARASLYRIAAKHNLKPVFNSEIQHELELILANPGINDDSLTDLTHLAFCSIDGADTRDLDQAVYIEQNNQEHIIYYALADASYYVRPGSALFEEALIRGASYYLPGLMIPMLPRVLCEDLISLNEGVDRRALVIQMHLDQSGHCIKTEIVRARIRNCAKLSFQDVLQFLERDQSAAHANQSAITDNKLLAESLRQLKTVGERRLRHAEQRHVVRYRRIETNIKLGDQGLIFTILSELRNDVEVYNEQLSLLCNTEAARLLSTDADNNSHVQAIYRVHPEPPLENILAFEKALAALVENRDLDPAVWLWKSNTNTSLSEYLRKLPQTGSYARISQVIHRQAVLTNVRSVFSDQADQHYGVGSDIYARFSAPMREIVGVFLHKELFEKINEKQHASAQISDEVLRDKVIQVANHAREKQKQITREANRLVLDQLFKADIHGSLDQRKRRLGTVMGMNASRLYVLLDEPGVEVKVYVEYLSEFLETKLQLDQDAVALSRQDNQTLVTRIGDAVSIIVKSWDEQRDRWVLLIDE